MNWQMWLLVSLLVSILVILIALAIVLYFQNRLIGSLSHELKKSLENHAALEKSFQRSLERHSERVVGTTEYLKTWLQMLNLWHRIMKMKHVLHVLSLKKLIQKSKSINRSWQEKIVKPQESCLIIKSYT